MTRANVSTGQASSAFRNPVLRFAGDSVAPAEVVYDLLSDLRSHVSWGGEQQGETTRLLTLDAPTGPAHVGTEFRSTGSDGASARWSDRSVVTEATRPEVFEFVTEGKRQGKQGTSPWLLTAVHRYELFPRSGGCRVTYTQDITRLEGAPWILTARGLNRLVFRVSAKFMRRGFDALLAMANEHPNPRASD